MNCWEDGPTAYQTETRLIGSTCMLPDGHEGEHYFTPDTEISIGFIT